MARLHILRPFVYSSQPSPGHKLPRERHFKKGHIEISDDDPMLADPWITKHFADGAIETPQAARARADAAAQDAERATQEAQRATASAEQALARAGTSHVSRVNETQLQKDLNTPTNELRGRSGSDVDTVSPEQRRAATEAKPATSADDDDDGQDEGSNAGQEQGKRGRGRGKGARSR